ncbi:MAG: TRAP transporter small permease [Psychromonas sp.]
MRSLLDKIYLSSGVLSGVCMIAICAIILARVIGRWLGIEVPSSDDFAGFLLAASSFLGLAYTFRQGGHIRVNLFTSRLPTSMHRYVDSVVLILGSLLIIYLSWHLAYMVYESYIFEELSSGYVAVELWLVQLPLAIGMLIFTIACIDQTIATVICGATMPKSEEELLVEVVSIQQPEVQESEDTSLEPMGSKL